MFSPICKLTLTALVILFANLSEQWELKGVPLRLEFGPGESAGHFVSTARRDIPGKEGKGSIAISELGTAVPALLETIHRDMYNRANEQFTTHRKIIEKFDEIVPALNDKNLVVVPFCLAEDCEDQIKKETAKKQEDISQSGPEDVKVCISGVPNFFGKLRLTTTKAPSMGAKSLCIPFDQGIGGGEITAETKCINPKCTRSAQKWCMFGRMFPLSRFPIHIKQRLTLKFRFILNLADFICVIHRNTSICSIKRTQLHWDFLSRVRSILSQMGL